MLDEYVGREVSAEAVSVLYDALLDAGCNPKQFPPPQTFKEPDSRLNWTTALALMDAAEQCFSPDELKAIGGAGLLASRFAKRMGFAKRFLTLEDAFRFMVFPHGDIDFACIMAAVRVRPGHIEVTAVVQERYEPHRAFFYVMLGAAEAATHQLGYEDAKVVAQIERNRLQYDITFSPRTGLLYRTKSIVSRTLHTLYVHLNFMGVYRALIDRTFLLRDAWVKLDQSRTHGAQDAQKLAQALNRLDALALEFDGMNRVVRLSGNPERFLGLSHQAVQKDPLRLFASADRIVVERYFEQMRPLPSGQHSFEWQRVDGSYVPVVCHVDHYDTTSEITWGITAHLDVRPQETQPQNIEKAGHTLQPVEVAPRRSHTRNYGTPRTLLLADDDSLTCRISRGILEQAGFVVKCASDGAEALSCLNHEQFDVAVLDIHMPKLSGDALYESLKAREDHTPVVFLTGDPPAIANRFPDVPIVAKPFRAEQLINTVEANLH